MLWAVLTEHPTARAGTPGPCPEGAEDADGSRILVVAFTSKGLGGAGNFFLDPFPRTM